jgi:hypothetical protein
MMPFLTYMHLIFPLPEDSLLNAILHNPTQPCLPSSLLEFPCDPTTTSPSKSLSTTPGPLILQIVELPDFPLVMDSLTRVVGYPRIFGLKSNSSSYVQVRRLATLLIDGGANACLTGDLDLLVNLIEIPSLPILVAINAENSTLNNSCTRQRYLPLTLSDGSTHWQLCFYCKNAVETIISPPAILASSNVFASWTQAGFKDGRPGQIHFDSHDGLVTMHLDLDCRDGLYYCPTDVFMVNRLPVRHPALHPFPPTSGFLG